MNTTTVLVKDRVAIYAVDAARLRTERARSDTRDTVNGIAKRRQSQISNSPSRATR